MFKLYVLLVVTSLVLQEPLAAGSISNKIEMWRHIEVDVLAMRKLSSAIAWPRTSIVQCGAIGMMQTTDTIICQSSSECIVLAADQFFLVSGPQTAGWKCLTSGIQQCELPDTSTVSMYASYSPEPGCGFVCRPSGLESNLPAPPITCCDSSKSATTAGCLKDLAANYSFVGAKTACRALGMDLFAPLVYTDFTALLAETSVQSRGAFFIGYVNRSGSWAWKSTIFRTGTIQVAVAAADWNATYPDPDMYWMCAVVVNQKIQNSLCATGINAVCHAPVPIC